MSLRKKLAELDACSPARDWVGDKTLAEAWQTCQRGDWLLWLAAKANIDRRLLVLAACDCAEPALVYVPAGEDRPRIAIETARAWANGEATLEAVSAAAFAAADAADAAADAAFAAADAANGAYKAAYAANAAADAAADAADDAAQAASLAHSADLVRARIPLVVIADALGGAL